MPRKSRVSLTVIPPTSGQRPVAPPELDGTERRVWEAIIGALPPTWLDPAAQQVLVRAVAQGSVCEVLETQLRALRAQERPDLDVIGTLAAQHAAAAKSLAHLLGVLRATPRARMVSRSASRQLTQVPHVRPWEAADG